MVNLNNTTPAAPGGHTNVAWQISGDDVSANIPTPGTGTVTHTGGALTSGLPVFGAGSGDVAIGTKTGNTTEVASASGSFTSGHGVVIDANGNLVDSGAAPPASVQPYDLNCALVGKPGAAAIVFVFTAVRAVTFAANFSGAYGSVGANPASTAAYDVKNNGTTIGAVSISTGGVFTFTTVSGTSKSLAAGDRLTIIAPSSQDTTLSDVGFTLAGTR